jgi:hypothetical protein
MPRFGLLNFSYQSKFFGQDVLQQDKTKSLDYLPRPRNDQDNILTVLSPKQKVQI